MKPKAICLQCLQFYTCQLTSVTAQCPILPPKSEEQPFDKEMPDKKPTPWELKWYEGEGRYL